MDSRWFLILCLACGSPKSLEDDAKVWFENELQRAIAETTELFSVSHGDGVTTVPVCDLMDLVVDQMAQHAIDGTGFGGQAGVERNTLIRLKEFDNVWDDMSINAISFLPSGIELNDIHMADFECVFCGLKSDEVSDPLARTLRNDEIKGKFIDSLRQSILKEGSWDRGVTEWKQDFIDDPSAIGKHATVFKAPLVLERLLRDRQSFRFRDHGSGGIGGGGSGGGGSGGGGGGYLGFDMGLG